LLANLTPFSLKAWLDFEGLPTNTIGAQMITATALAVMCALLCPLSTKHSWSLRSEGVVIDGVHLKGENKVKCSLVKGTFKECKACSKCEGLTSPME
jgi:hypothetical protein